MLWQFTTSSTFVLFLLIMHIIPIFLPTETTSQKAYEWFCGSTSTIKLTRAEKAEQLEQLTNIEENPFWSRVCDVNAIIAVALTCFIIGFYG